MCYCEHVEALKQNLTLTIEDDLLQAARRVALDKRTSVNQMVREFLVRLVAEPDRRKMARARLMNALDTGLVEVGDRTWTRDDLYDR